MNNYFNCVYMYVNKINNHRYIGQTNNFKRRHWEHISDSNRRHRKEYNSPLSKAFRKYGIENFEIIILKENLKTRCLLNFWECYYIDKYNCLSKKNYNLSNGGSNGNPYANKTEEEMQEIFNDEWCKKRSILVKGENNPRSRKIIQYNLNGDFIKIWDYAKKASEELRINYQSIIHCCRGRNKTAGDYIWKYYEEDDAD